MDTGLGKLDEKLHVVRGELLQLLNMNIFTNTLYNSGSVQTTFLSMDHITCDLMVWFKLNKVKNLNLDHVGLIQCMNTK